MSKTSARPNDKSKEQVRAYWNSKPCGSEFVEADQGTREYYESLEAVRYELEPHILVAVPFGDFRDKDVLEIGCGSGIDALQFGRADARYTGVDLTPAAVELTRKAYDVFGLHGRFQVADAERLPFEDSSFDLVYSHGVLHHTPDTQQALGEVRRVLRPGGRAIIMLYHRRSYNYYGNIMFFRRIGVHLLRPAWAPRLLAKVTGYDQDVLEAHRQERLRQRGMSREDFLSINTDGPGNPLSKVYTSKEVKEIFSEFSEVNTRQYYLNKRHVPLVGRHIPGRIDFALGRLAGWHLYIYAVK